MNLKSRYSFYASAFISLLLPNITKAATPAFVYGADIGWATQLEANGVVWQNESGAQTALLTILKNEGVNTVRLRTFVNPNANGMTPDGYMQGYCNQAQTITMAQTCKAAGFNVMIDFQYSDDWTVDAFATSTSWPSDCLTSLPDLETALYNYTYNFMTALLAAGVTPTYVQCGNEILNGPGYCYPLGENLANLDAIQGTGYDAVKAASPSTIVVTHLGTGADGVSFFDQFFSNGGKTDAIGYSYYPVYEGDTYPTGFASNISGFQQLVTDFNLPILICEQGAQATAPGNTNALCTATINAMKSLPNSMGLGVIYWEPESNNTIITGGYSYGATTEVGTNVARFTTAMDAFLTTSEGNYCSNPGFEVDSAATSTPSGWTEWGTGGSVLWGSGAHGGSGYGTQKASAAFSASTYQTQYVPDGTYTLTAWVKSSGGQSTAQMFVNSYGGSEIDYAINTSISGWTQITIANIAVTANSIEFGFYSVASANQWIDFDDVSLTETGSGGGGITSGGVYTLVSKYSGQALDNGSTSTEGAKVLQWDVNGGSAQNWMITLVSGNYYTLKNGYSGDALDNDSETGNGASVVQWALTSGTPQQWEIVSEGGGYYELVSKYSGEALDNGSTSTEGADVEQWTVNGGSAQLWKLTLQ